MSYFLGVDVGTSSTRAGLFDSSGELLAEQSSEEIFESVCVCIKRCVNLAVSSGAKSFKIDSISSIGVDATCSLVVLGKDDLPISVSSNKRLVEKAVFKICLAKTCVYGHKC